MIELELSILIIKEFEELFKKNLLYSNNNSVFWPFPDIKGYSLDFKVSVLKKLKELLEKSSDRIE